LETGQMPEFRKSNQVSAEIIKYILDNYEPRCSRTNGILAMARKLNIEENIIRNILTYESKYRQMYHLT
jgi:predicted component of type VI protein secretion system